MDRPVDGEFCGRAAQRPVLHRVSRQLMNAEGERLGGGRRQRDGRPLQRHPARLHRLVGRSGQFGFKKRTKINVILIDAGQKALHAAYGLQSAFELRLEGVERRTLSQGLAGDRLDDCEQVAGAMLQFRHHDLLAALQIPKVVNIRHCADPVLGETFLGDGFGSGLVPPIFVVAPAPDTMLGVIFACLTRLAPGLHG